VLEEFATFCAIVKSGSMSKAASDLHVSQPAVSQRLRTLEQAYGMQLLLRTNRGVELTPAGELLSRYARRLINLHNNLQEEMEALRSAEPSQVIIGATSAAGGYALPCTIFLFQQTHPAAKIQLVVGNRSETLQRLHDGALDLALVEGQPVPPHEDDREGWQATEVSEEELVLVTPVTGPWAELPVYTLEDLRRAPLILREQGSGVRQVVEQELQNHGLSISQFPEARELCGVNAGKTAVAAGHGVTLLSKWCVRVEARIGTVRIAPLQGIRFLSRWTLLYPAARQGSILIRSLVHTLRSPAERGFC
jgi:DNA-binding transcriptional LysR family regulator